MTRSPIITMRLSLKVAAALALYIIVFAVLIAMKAEAHDALPTSAKPQGWNYPFSCCSGYDCREVSDASIVEDARGYLIRQNGDLLPMTSPKVKDSPDGKFHLCTVAGKDDGKTICLFVPPRGF